MSTLVAAPSASRSRIACTKASAYGGAPPVLGFHFQVFKMHWRLKASKARHNKGTMADYVPCCDAEGNATRQHFSIDLANGFRCGVSQEPRACKAGYF